MFYNVDICFCPRSQMSAACLERDEHFARLAKSKSDIFIACQMWWTDISIKSFDFFFEWRCTFCGSTISHYLAFFMQTKFFLQKHAHFIFLSLKSIQNTHRLLSLSLSLSLSLTHIHTIYSHVIDAAHLNNFAHLTFPRFCFDMRNSRRVGAYVDAVVETRWHWKSFELFSACLPNKDRSLFSNCCKL
jgi:hypothetical protein